jgi:hypothetical protein
MFEALQRTELQPMFIRSANNLILTSKGHLLHALHYVCSLYNWHLERGHLNREEITRTLFQSERDKLWKSLGYGLDDRGSISDRIWEFFFATGSKPALGPTHSYPTSTGCHFLGIKRPWREPYHSPPCSDQVKNAWSCTSTPQYVFI